MAQRRWGPTLGAGVVIIEREAAKLAEAAPLGVTLYLGQFEKGDVGELSSTLSKGQFEKIIGSYYAGAYGPDCAFDFWDHGQGAGELHIIRVTDGNEREAEFTFWNRRGTDLAAVMKVKAKNGGRWGGKKAQLGGVMTTPATELTETTLDTGLTMLENEWIGASLVFDEISGKSYKVVSNTTAGVITVESDSKMSTDYGTGTDNGWALFLTNLDDFLNEQKAVSVEIGDGDEDALNYFSLTVYVDGVFVKRYANLSMDPTHKYYFVNIINDDASNDEIEVENLWTGGIASDVRPANEYGLISAITDTVLTSKLFEFEVTSPGGADPTVVLGTTNDSMQYRDTITCTVTDDITGAYDVSSAKFGAQGSGTLGTPFVPEHPYVAPHTITDGSTALATGDIVKIYYFPFEVDSLIGGTLIPDYPNERRSTWRIADNDHNTITVQEGDSLTTVAAIDDEFMVISPRELEGGYDGITPTDPDFSQWLDIDTSPANVLKTQNKGLVKMATPGWGSSSLDKIAFNFVEAKNWQYRVEIPSAQNTEVAAETYINDTVGRNDFGVTIFPSWTYVDDPQRPGMKKLIPQTGAVHGREALVAKNWDGYHKAAAGEDVTLFRVLELPTAEPLNEEFLNPQGINVIRKMKGNYVVWGDRTISLDPAWKWKHQRELMSHLENRLMESFTWIVFAINDPITWQTAKTALRAFFLPEWQKRALRGDKPDDAFSIKIDSENNTNLTMAAGDLYADIVLRLADTVERFIIRIGKAGFFESVS